MILTGVKVHNLFGELDHTLTFNDSRRITYIIGRNGTGKTTVLQMIDAIAKGDWHYLTKIQFDSICLSFGQNHSLCISKSPEHDLLYEHVLVQYHNDNENIEKQINATEDKYVYGNKNFDASLIDKLVADGIISKLKCGHWRSKERRHMRDKEVLRTYGNSIWRQLPQQVSQLLYNWHVTFLSAERHIADDPIDSYNQEQKCYVVDNIAEDIIIHLRRSEREVLQRLEEISDELVQNLLSDGLGSKEFELIDNKSFQTLYEHYSKYRVRLEESLLSPGPKVDYEQNGSRNDTERSLIAYIIQQRLDAYEPYAEMLHSLELFNELLTETLTRKTVKASLPAGIYIKTDSGQEFPPNHLSSGEQQVVILAHTLLFNMPRNSLALIDEPELSMDVEWQSKLSNWLERVGEEKNLQFILATHSPLLFIGRSKEAIQTFTP